MDNRSYTLTQHDAMAPSGEPIVNIYRDWQRRRFHRATLSRSVETLFGSFANEWPIRVSACSFDGCTAIHRGAYPRWRVDGLAGNMSLCNNDMSLLFPEGQDTLYIQLRHDPRVTFRVLSTSRKVLTGREDTDYIMPASSVDTQLCRVDGDRHRLRAIEITVGLREWEGSYRLEADPDVEGRYTDVYQAIYAMPLQFPADMVSRMFPHVELDALSTRALHYTVRAVLPDEPLLL